jgi:hypothetical protein
VSWLRHPIGALARILAPRWAPARLVLGVLLQTEPASNCASPAPLASGLAGYDLSVNEEKTPAAEGDPEDDPRRHTEPPTTPPGEDSGEERAEKVAGDGGDVSDEESYEGGLPA